MKVRNPPFLELKNPKVSRTRIFLTNRIKEPSKMTMGFDAVGRDIIGTVGKAELRDKKRETVASNELEASPGFIRKAVYFSTFRDPSTEGGRNIAICPVNFAGITKHCDVRN